MRTILGLLLIPAVMVISARAAVHQPLTNNVAVGDKVHLSLNDGLGGSQVARLFDTEVFADKPLSWILFYPANKFDSSASPYELITDPKLVAFSDRARVAFLGMQRAFDFKLFDHQGQEVAKTAAGKEMSKGPVSVNSLSRNWGANGRTYLFLNFYPGQTHETDFGILTNLFKFPSDGDYILEVKYWNWNAEKERFILSDPVRLKVIKRPPTGATVGGTNAPSGAPGPSRDRESP